MKALEAFIGSFGILLAGFLTIPLAAHLVGGSLTIAQGAGMSLLFFVARWLWLYSVRVYFERKKERLIA
jgi:hypothetical protein